MELPITNSKFNQVHGMAILTPKGPTNVEAANYFIILVHKGKSKFSSSFIFNNLN
jgi:hypothetical protein